MKNFMLIGMMVKSENIKSRIDTTYAYISEWTEAKGVGAWL